MDGHRIEGSCVSVRKSEESTWSGRQEETGVGRAPWLSWSVFSEGVVTVSTFSVCCHTHNLFNSHSLMEWTAYTLEKQHYRH